MTARKKSTPVRSPKKQKRRSRRKPKARASWPRVMERLNDSVSGKTRVAMGTTNSAHATRVRLLKTYNNITVRVVDKILVIEVV